LSLCGERPKKAVHQFDCQIEFGMQVMARDDPFHAGTSGGEPKACDHMDPVVSCGDLLVLAHSGR
jgi:hypothetical protein